MRDAMLPRNVAKLLDPERREQGPLEQWQEDYLRQRELEALGLEDDEWQPVIGLSHKQEDELAWRDERVIIDDGGRFCGKRWTGEAFDQTNPMHAAAAANDVDGGPGVTDHKAWDDET